MIVFVAMTVRSISFSCGVFMPIGLTYFFHTQILPTCVWLLNHWFMCTAVALWPVLWKTDTSVSYFIQQRADNQVPLHQWFRGWGWWLGTRPAPHQLWVSHLQKEFWIYYNFFWGGLYTSKQISGFYSLSWGVCLDFVEALGEKSLAWYKVLKTS